MKSKNVKTKTLRYFLCIVSEAVISSFDVVVDAPATDGVQLWPPSGTKLIQCFLVYVKTSINQRKDNGDLKATRKVMKRKIEMLLMQQ